MTEAHHFCSFCGKSQHDVKKMVEGDKATICDECVITCMRVMMSPPPIQFKQGGGEGA